MHRTLQNCLDMISVSPDPTAMLDAMSKMAHLAGFSQFAYISIPAKSPWKPILISNYSKLWLSRYIDNRFDQIDPVIINAKRNPEPFSWGLELDTGSLTPAQRSFFEEARNHGIWGGFTIPLDSSDHALQAITFAANEAGHALSRGIDRHRMFLHLAALLFQRRADIVLSGDNIVGGIKLTKRQFQCLAWAAQGKSAWEIGKLLGVSARTAIFHLSHVRQKLGVRTITQAVAMFASEQRGGS
jgi:LuxR family transcriptional activator of conjugal transfer of Ti plasmids